MKRSEIISELDDLRGEKYDYTYRKKRELLRELKFLKACKKQGKYLIFHAKPIK